MLSNKQRICLFNYHIFEPQILSYLKRNGTAQNASPLLFVYLVKKAFVALLTQNRWHKNDYVNTHKIVDYGYLSME